MLNSKLIKQGLVILIVLLVVTPQILLVSADKTVQEEVQEASQQNVGVADIAGAALPFATGLGLDVRAVSKMDDVGKIVSKGEKVGGVAGGETAEYTSSLIGGNEYSFSAKRAGLSAVIGGVAGGVAGKIASRSSKGITFSETQLQKKFYHAEDFGITWAYNKQNVESFKNSLMSHIN